MKVEIAKVDGRSGWLVRVDSCEISFKTQAEAEAFAKQLQARLDAPHPLPTSSRVVLSRRS